MYDINFKINTGGIMLLDSTKEHKCKTYIDDGNIAYVSEEIHIGSSVMAYDILRMMFCDLRFNFEHFDTIKIIYDLFEQMLHFVQSDLKETREFTWYSHETGIPAYIIFKIKKF